MLAAVVATGAMVVGSVIAAPSVGAAAPEHASIGSHAVAQPAAVGNVDHPAAVGDHATLADHLGAARMSSYDAQMISYINHARTSRGLSALKEAAGLSRLSVWWSNQMLGGATGNKLQHNPNAWTQVTKYGAANRTAWGENVGKASGPVTAKALFDAYMASPEHKANILSTKYHYIGMGTVSAGGVLYNTTEFTDRVEGATPSKPHADKKPQPKPKPKATPKATPKASPQPARNMAVAENAAPKQAGNKAASSKKFDQAGQFQPQQPLAPKRPAAQQPAAAPQHAPIKPVSGTVATSFGALSLPGMTVEIRDAQCDAALRTATTASEGSFPVTLEPGNYCAVVVATPDGIATPDPVHFSVERGEQFQVSWSTLKTAPKKAEPPVQERSNFVMQLV